MTTDHMNVLKQQHACFALALVSVALGKDNLEISFGVSIMNNMQILVMGKNLKVLMSALDPSSSNPDVSRIQAQTLCFSSQYPVGFFSPFP